MPHPQITIVVPVFNEAGNIPNVLSEAAEVFAEAFESFEIIAVDDGSSDASWTELEAASAADPRIRPIRHPKRSGKSAALRTGMRAARSIWVATMDGDGQDDPRAIPAMASKIDLASVGDVGLVGAVRANRTDGGARKWASKLANSLRSTFLDDDCPDTACGLKLIPRDLFLALPFFDALHRYLPPLTKHLGFSGVWVEVANRPRGSGASKYTNIGRAAAGLFDLMGVIWLMRRTTVPDKSLLIARGGEK